MLFFFELFLFVLIMLTLALGEFVSRGMALTLWLVMAVFALVGYVAARRPLNRRAEAATDPVDERWARTLLYNWRRTNALLVLGMLAVGAWYWLGRA